MRAEHVGRDELPGGGDRAVHVGLRGEVHDSPAPVRGPGRGHRVGNVAVDELVRNTLEVRAIARVGQLVQHDDFVARGCEADARSGCR